MTNEEYSEKAMRTAPDTYRNGFSANEINMRWIEVKKILDGAEELGTAADNLKRGVFYRIAHGHTNDKIERVELIHALIGIIGEVGELCEADANYEEEIGDLLWYVTLLCKHKGLSLSRIMEKNISKLAKRYPLTYSDQDALARKDKS